MRSGVVLLMLAMFLTPGIDGVSKHLGASYSPFSIAFLRYLCAGLIALAIARALGQPLAIPRAARVGQVARTALLMGAMTSLIGALSVAPMATAAGGFLIAPVVATAVGVMWQSERLTLPRALGAVLSVVGAALILRPETSMSLGAALALFGGALLGVYLSATRVAEATGGTLATLAVQCLLGAAMLCPLALWQGMPAASAGVLGWALILGMFSAGAHFLTVAAFEREESAVLAPFFYFNLIAAVVAGYFFFGEIPGAIAGLGLALIMGGGLVTLMAPARLHLALISCVLVSKVMLRESRTVTNFVTERILRGIIGLQNQNGGDHDGFVASERTQAETSGA